MFTDFIWLCKLKETLVVHSSVNSSKLELKSGVSLTSGWMMPICFWLWFVGYFNQLPHPGAKTGIALSGPVLLVVWKCLSFAQASQLSAVCSLQMLERWSPACMNAHEKPIWSLHARILPCSRSAGLRWQSSTRASSLNLMRDKNSSSATAVTISLQSMFCNCYI